MAGVVIIPYRRNVSHFPMLLSLMMLGGFLWPSCRTCGIILEVFIFKNEKSVEKEKKTSSGWDLSQRLGITICVRPVVSPSLCKNVSEFLVHMERMENQPWVESPEV